MRVVMRSCVRADFEAREYPQKRQENEARFGGIENVFGEAQSEMVKYSQVRKNANVIDIMARISGRDSLSDDFIGI